MVSPFTATRSAESMDASGALPPAGDEPSEPGERTSEAPPVYHKSPQEKRDILESLSSSFLFDALGAPELATLVDAMKATEVDAGDVVIREGDTGDKFYVVDSGNLSVTLLARGEVGTLTRHNTFGELALMYDNPRAASVTAVTPCKLWALDRRTFKRVVVRSAAAAVHEKVHFLRRVEILSPLSRRDLYRLAEVLTSVTFSANQTILTQGETGSAFYIIKSGQVSVFKRDGAGAEDVEVIRLGIGSYFGEQSLIHKQARSASVRAIGTVECLAMHGEFFESLLGPIVVSWWWLRVFAAGPSGCPLAHSFFFLFLLPFLCSVCVLFWAAWRVHQPSMHKVHSRRELAEGRVRSSRNMMRQLDSMDSLSPSASRSPMSPVRRARCDVELADLDNVAVLGEGAFGVVRLVKHKVHFMACVVGVGLVGGGGALTRRCLLDWCARSPNSFTLSKS